MIDADLVQPIALNLGVFTILIVIWRRGFANKDQTLVRALVVFAAAVWIQSRLDLIDEAHEDIYAISKTSINMSTSNLRNRLQLVRALTAEDVAVLDWLDRLGSQAGRIYRLVGPSGMKCAWCAPPLKGEISDSYLWNYAIYGGIFLFFRLAIDVFALTFAGAICIYSWRWINTQCLLLALPVSEVAAKVYFGDSLTEFDYIRKMCKHTNLLIAMGFLAYLEGTIWAAGRTNAPENVLARANAMLAHNFRTFGALFFVDGIKGRDAKLAQQETTFWSQQDAFVNRVWSKVDKVSPVTDSERKVSEDAVGSFVSRDGTQAGYTLSGVDYETLRRILRLPA